MIKYDILPAMGIYIGLDLGTSVIKGTAIDDDGKTLASFSKETPLISRKSSWIEQSPELWWSVTMEILNLLATKVDMAKVKGIGLSGQMHGLVVYDEKYSVLRRAMVWLDKRTQDEVEDILNKVGRQSLYKITGNPVFTGFLLPSLLWVKNNEPEIYKKIFKVSSPKDYIAYRLTGVLRSEPTDALATAAFDYKKDAWSEKIITKTGLKKDIFPSIKPTMEPYGGITRRVARISGLPTGIPVYGGSDQSMAALGSGLIEEGHSALAISTGGQFLVVAKKGIIDPKRRLHTLNHAVPGVGLYMAATLSAGLSLRWFKDEVVGKIDYTYDKFTKGIEEVEIGSGGIFFLPFLAGERTPYFNSNLRGGFIGLSITHSRAQMVRAIIEGVSFSMLDCLEVFKDLDLSITKIILSGGGSKNLVWRQILTDVLDIPTQTINIENHSPFGAAILAKFATSGFEGLPAFYKKVIHASDFLYPNENNTKRYKEIYKDYKNIVSFFNKRLYSPAG